MISIICPSPKAREMAYFIKREFNANLYIKEYANNESYLVKNNKNENLLDNVYSTSDFNLKNITQKAFEFSDGIIFIGSTGIAVRAIAPFIKSKDKDPGVVVVDLENNYSISLLSGHLGGGNELAIKVSKILNNTPIITTATDNLGIIAPDVLSKKNNLIIEDLKKAKYISALLVQNMFVGMKDDYNVIVEHKGYKIIKNLKEDCVWITHKIKEDFRLNKNDEVIDKEVTYFRNLDYSKILRLIKRDLILGIGCRKNMDSKKLEECVKKHLIMNNLDIRAVKEIVSVEIKKDEKAIINLSEKLKCEFNTFSIDEIKRVQHKFSGSEFVLKNIGVTSVCEPCVDLSGAKIIIDKIKDNGITLCIGVTQ